MSIPIPPDPPLSPFHPTLEQTAVRAGFWHGAQLDKAGRPYIEHLMQVASGLLRMFPDASPAERHAAWLHDVIEDIGVTAEDLRALNYASEVIEIVQALSRPDGTTYADWIDDMARTAPLGALRVKLADLASNADPVRLSRLDPERAARLASRYGKAAAVLRQALRDRTGTIGDSEPEPADLVPLTLHIEPVDFWVLGEAAGMADRTAAEFMTEEALDLAHRIVATGSLRHVNLARDRRSDDAPAMDAFRASQRKQGPLTDFMPTPNHTQQRRDD